MADEKKINSAEIMSEEELDNVAGGATYIYYFPAVRGNIQGFKVVRSPHELGSREEVENIYNQESSRYSGVYAAKFIPANEAEAKARDYQQRGYILRGV